ncbi:MAG: hypothetical protein KDK48_05535, partial [Chlamydiia bacterium]|nr:hypothetical protein [Chlamydiia bacterium]
ALLRLMSDGDKQALLIERIYPQTLGSAEKKALVDFAIERSDTLQLSLYSHETEGTPSRVTLTSLPGRGTCQYVDAASGLQHGTYSLNNLQLLRAYRQ